MPCASTWTASSFADAAKSSGASDYLSGGCRSLTGFAPEDLLHNHRLSFESLIHPDDRYGVREQRGAAIERGHNYQIEYRLYHADGLLRWVSERGGRQRGGGRKGGAQLEGVILDITARKLADLAAGESERRYRGLFDHAIEGIFRTTTDGRYLAANPALARIYGFDSSAELIESLQDIRRQLYVDPTQREEFMHSIRARGSVDRLRVAGFPPRRLHHLDLGECPCGRGCRGQPPLLRGHGGRYHRPQTLRARLERQANYDALTGLPTERCSTTGSSSAFLTAEHSGSPPAVIFIDLDRFKFINDSLGASDRR